MTSTTLAAAMTVSSQTITLASGTLTVDALVAVDSEYVSVVEVYSATAGRVQRGVNGSSAAAHDNGADAIIATASEFLTGPAIVPPFGPADDALTAQGPSVAPLYAAGGGGASILHQGSITLTNDQILALTDPGTLVEVVAAPGADKLLIFVHGVFVPSFAANYTLPAGTNFANIVYGDFDDDASTKVDATSLFGATGKIVSGLLPLSTAPGAGAGFVDNIYWGLVSNSKTNQINKPFKFYAESHSPYTWTGGDASNTMLVSVVYLILNTLTGLFE